MAGIPRKGIGGVFDKVKDSVRDILKIDKNKGIPTTSSDVGNAQRDTTGKIVRDTSGNIVPRRSGRGGGSSGGGASSSSPSSAEITRREQERLRQVEQLRTKQEEAKKLQEQIREQRQQKAFNQTIAGQVKANQSENNMQSFGMTTENFNVRTPSNVPPIYLDPVIEERTIGSSKDSRGRNIPTTGFVLVEPPKLGQAGVTKETPIVPSAVTPSGKVFRMEGFEDVTIPNEANISSEKRTFRSKARAVVDPVFGGVSSSVREIEGDITSSIRGRFSEEQSERQKQNVIESTDFLSSRVKTSTQSLIDSGIPKPLAKLGGGIASVGVYGGGLIAGATGSIAEKTIERPIVYPARYAVIGGASAGVGFALQGGVAGASAINPILGSVVQYGAIGGGLILGGAEVVSKAEKFKGANVFERGGILGETALEVGASVGGFKSGARGFSKVDPFTKIVETTPVRVVRTPEFVEKSFRVVKDGKETRVANYIISGETRPPILKTTTTAFRKRFGLDPLEIEVIPSREFKITTPFNAIGNDPFITAEFRQGSKVVRLRNVGGSSQDINPRSENIAPLDRFLFQRYAESITGRTISEKNALRLFEAESDFAISSIQTKKILKANVRNNIVEIPQAGRRTDLNIALTRTKPLLETETIRGFTSETFFKDVTKPLARKTGRTPKLKGEIYELKEPIVLSESTNLGFIKPSDIVKTPMSKTFQDTRGFSGDIQKTALELQKNQLAKILPKPSRLPPKTKIINQVQLTSSSRFAGTGLYELTENTPTIQTLNTKGLNLIRQSPLDNVKDLSIVNVITSSNLANELDTKLVSKQKSSSKQINSLKLDVIQKLQPQLKTVQKQKQSQKQKQALKQKLTTKPQNLFSYAPRIPRPPTLLSPPPFFKLGLRNKFIGRAQIGRRVGGYQPSFTASALGITAREVPKSELLGGLALRPVIVKGKKKGKRVKRKLRRFWWDD